MSNPAKFMREVRQEVNKVTWPTRKETTVSATMVIIITTIMAIFFLITDSLIGSAVQWILGIGG